jgi:hypothetical protein
VDTENDTGILVTHLSQTIEESRRLRENLTHGSTGAPEVQEGALPAADAPPKEDVTSPDPLSRPD